MSAADWISFRMLLAAVALVGVAALFLGDSWGRWRIRRTDLRRSGSAAPSDQLLGSRLPRPVGAESVERGTPAAHVLDFDSGYTSNRRRLTPLEDRWRRLELEGLAMSPFDLDGHRRDNR